MRTLHCVVGYVICTTDNLILGVYQTGRKPWNNVNTEKQYHETWKIEVHNLHTNPFIIMISIDTTLWQANVAGQQPLCSGKQKPNRNSNKIVNICKCCFYFICGTIHGQENPENNGHNQPRKWHNDSRVTHKNGFVICFSSYGYKTYQRQSYSQGHNDTTCVFSFFPGGFATTQPMAVWPSSIYNVSPGRLRHTGIYYEIATGHLNQE